MNNKRFEELLPWYVNGSLGAEDRAWVDAYLAQHPEARSELDWYRSLQTRVQESAPAVPATIGLAQRHAPDPGRPSDLGRAHRRLLRQLRHAPELCDGRAGARRACRAA